jgi:hypothetical protein
MTTTTAGARGLDAWTGATFAEARDWLSGDVSWRDVFGDVGGDGWLEEAHEIYRAAARVVHPDAVRAECEVDAAICFVTLGGLWEQAQSWAGAGGAFALETKRGSYVCDGLLARGSLSDVYRCTYTTEHGATGSGAAKIFRNAANSDLAKAESAAWAKLAGVDVGLAAYFPETVSSFGHRGSDRAVRRVNVSVELEGFYTLKQVRDVYRGGVDGRSAVWMWRRLLVALGAASRQGLVHGCITPEHVMIHPAKHGLGLIDWCYSVEAGAKLAAIEPRYSDWYPPGVLAGEKVGFETDLFMAAKTMAWLMGELAPKQLVAFAEGCCLSGAGMAPHDGWELLGELDDLCERLWGPRRFVPFSMPEATGR